LPDDLVAAALELVLAGARHDTVSDHFRIGRTTIWRRLAGRRRRR
jgi:hypothetical protein